MFNGGRGGEKKRASLGSAESEPGILLQLSDFQKTKGEYNPKDIVVMCDELGELMNNDNFKLVSSIKEKLGSIARLGRAAGFHLVLATQKATSGVISSELMNNIHQSVLLGEFDSGVSTSMFEKDISYKAKPEIPGRGFTKSGKEIIEFQAYWTTEKDFKYVDKTLFEQAEQATGLNHGTYEENKALFEQLKENPDSVQKESFVSSDDVEKESESASVAVAEKPKSEPVEGGAPERTVSRKEVLDENGEIDYQKFL